MNSAPIALRLASGSVTPAQPVEEALLGVDGHERDLEVVAEGGDDLLALVLAHQPVVDEHAGQLVADRAVHEQRGDRRVDPAGEPADHAPVADLGADRGDLLVDDRGGAPGARRSRRCPRGTWSGPAARRACGRPRGGTGCRRGRARRPRPRRPATRSSDASAREARRRREDRVAVRHPARLLAPACRPAGGPCSRTVSCERPNSPTSAPSTRPPSVEHQRLHAVTDAEHRDPELEQLRVEPRRARRVHRRRAAGEDQALRRAPARPPRRRRGAAAARRTRRTRARGARSAASTGPP